MSGEVIDSFSQLNAYLSNFFPSPIMVGGIEYPTVEHAFQAAKTIDPDEQRWVREAGTPGMAKRRGRQVQIHGNWSRIRASVMAELLMRKFTQHPRLKRLLIETGNATLIEGNTWHDQYWGDCRCAKHQGTPGKNLLGALLMELRERLKQAE